jgi:hypothetical protein
MVSMKRFCLALLCSGVLTFAADLSNVHSVYILSMSHGLDQFLANSLTNGHVLKVVTDPKGADAILTDQVGEHFEKKLADLLPSLDPVKPPPPAPKTTQPQAGPGPMVDPSAKLAPPPSSFGHANGTIFLVDPKSHQVLWSTYQSLKGTDSKELDRTASGIVSRFKKDLNPPVSK